MNLTDFFDNLWTVSLVFEVSLFWQARFLSKFIQKIVAKLLSQIIHYFKRAKLYIMLRIVLFGRYILINNLRDELVTFDGSHFGLKSIWEGSSLGLSIFFIGRIAACPCFVLRHIGLSRAFYLQMAVGEIGWKSDPRFFQFDCFTNIRIFEASRKIFFFIVSFSFL